MSAVIFPALRRGVALLLVLGCMIACQAGSPGTGADTASIDTADVSFGELLDVATQRSHEAAFTGGDQLLEDALRTIEEREGVDATTALRRSAEDIIPPAPGNADPVDATLQSLHDLASIEQGAPVVQQLEADEGDVQATLAGLLAPADVGGLSAAAAGLPDDASGALVAEQAAKSAADAALEAAGAQLGTDGAPAANGEALARMNDLVRVREARRTRGLEAIGGLERLRAIASDAIGGDPPSVVETANLAWIEGSASAADETLTIPADRAASLQQSLEASMPADQRAAWADAWVRYAIALKDSGDGFPELTSYGDAAPWEDDPEPGVDPVAGATADPASATDPYDGSDDQAAETAATAEVTRASTPAGRVDPFPAREDVEAAMQLYVADKGAARTQSPMSVAEFLGKPVTSSNIDKLRVELLRPAPDSSGPPLAFLSTFFHGGDVYWNDRYKDVQLFRLFDGVGIQDLFPEAEHVPTEGRALIRMWTNYTPLSSGAPPGLADSALSQELARILVASYVAGNMDGPAINPNNGGFALFQDASGVQHWRGVLIDNGAAWHPLPDAAKPWNTNVLGQGPVTLTQIPQEVIDGLSAIATRNVDDLANVSQFASVDDGARGIVRGEQDRAREVLDHYGVAYGSP
jgi:hypothetical protein